MVDLKAIGKLIVLISAIWVLGSIAMQPGLTGKVFVIIIVGIGYMIYTNIFKAPPKYDAVTDHYKQLRVRCRLNRNPYINMLKLTGDAANAKILKGKIIGGPTKLINKNLPDAHAKKNLLVFLYTPNINWMYTMPILSIIMQNFRKEILFGVYHNPLAKHSQLISKMRSDSSNEMDKHYIFFGDIEVRGVGTTTYGEIEYVNDEFFDSRHENAALKKHVDDLNFVDLLRSLGPYVKDGIEGNAKHQMQMDQLDEQGGTAK